jgi:acetyl-CoA C-acetyltransferase
LYDIVLVYGSSTTGAVVEAQQILNSASPPLIEKPCGAGAIHMGGYYLTRYQNDYGITAEDFAIVAAKSHKHAVNNPHAHVRKGFKVDEILASPMVCSPIHLYEVCPVSSGASCLVMASEELAKELSDTPVWVEAVGSITNSYLVGYRNFAGFPMLKILAKRVYEKAGIKNPIEDIDYAELFNPFAGFEYLEYEALGFCGEGEAPRLARDGVTDLGGSLPVNLSGSTLCTNSGISASINRHSETCLQLMGRIEGGRQVKDARVGLAHSWGGNMGQFHTVAILARK